MLDPANGPDLLRDAADRHDPIVRADRLSVEFEKPLHRPLENVDITLERGKAVGLIGENGSGKTTLGYALAGVIPKVIPAKVKGSISLDGVDISGLQVEEIGRKIGTVFQNPDDYFVCLRVQDDLNLDIRADPTAHLDEDAIMQVAARLGITDLLDAAPTQLSMGQRQKAALASTLLRGSQLLILDEPFANLDPPSRYQLKGMLRELCSQGVGLLVLSHSPGDLGLTTDVVFRLESGRLSETDLSGYDQGSELPRIQRTKAGGVDGSNEVTVSIQDLSVRYPGSRSFALDGVSLQLDQGSILAVAGSNGSGKTTLLLAMMGLLRPARGGCFVDSKRVDRMPFGALARKVGIAFQNPDHQIFATDIRQELEFGLRQMRLTRAEISARVGQVVDMIPDANLNPDPFSLSYGQRKILTILCLLAMDPEVFLLDEPELGLDRSARVAISRLLLDLRERGRSIVIATHDLDLMDRMADEIVLIHDGRTLAYGQAEEMLPQVRQHFEELTAAAG